jgi:hypothetical protein
MIDINYLTVYLGTWASLQAKDTEGVATLKISTYNNILQNIAGEFERAFNRTPKASESLAFMTVGLTLADVQDYLSDRIWDSRKGSLKEHLKWMSLDQRLLAEFEYEAQEIIYTLLRDHLQDVYTEAYSYARNNDLKID